MCANVEGGKHNENRLDRHVASYMGKKRDWTCLSYFLERGTVKAETLVKFEE